MNTFFIVGAAVLGFIAGALTVYLYYKQRVSNFFKLLHGKHRKYTMRTRRSSTIRLSRRTRSDFRHMRFDTRYNSRDW